MKEYIVQAKDNYDFWDLVMYQDGKKLKELIRCKDCLWHYGTICRRNNTMFWDDDGFCSYAEREEYETD